MSAICGIVHFGGAPLDRAGLDRMVGAQAYRGPDGQKSWTGPGAGVAHLALHTTPEALHEVQPRVDAESGLVLVADARLDDRRGLAQRLGLSVPPGGSEALGDAELVLAAYRRWGTACLRELLGDFAFAIWDPARRQLFCGRDAVGVRQLHYLALPGRLLFSTTVAGILAALDRTPALNRPLLEDQMAGRYERWVTETVYEGVRRLPPGHSLTLRDGRVQIERYWIWGEGEPFGVGDEAACVEEFRALFAAAVRDRERGVGPLGISVSGGLDSSSVACQLHHDRQRRSAVRLYTLQFDRTPRADEREYFQAVHETCADFPATRIPGDDFWVLKEFGADAGFCLDEPEVEINRGILAAPLRQLRQDGGRVMLSGHGGDQVLSGNPYHNPLLVADLPLARLPSELPHFVRLCRRPAWYLLGYSYFRPWVPDQACAWVRPRRRALSSGSSTPVTPAGSPGPPHRGHSSRDRARTLGILTGGSYQAHLLWMDRLAAYCGVEFRFPFLDRRVIEFQLRLPPALRFRDGWTKYLLRRAMEGVLPDKVRERKSYATFGELADRGCKETARSRVELLMCEPRSVAAGLVSEAALAEFWKRLCATEGHRFLPLRGFLYVETWLRHLEEASREPARPAVDRLAPACFPGGLGDRQ